MFCAANLGGVSTLWAKAAILRDPPLKVFLAASLRDDKLSISKLVNPNSTAFVIIKLALSPIDVTFSLLRQQSLWILSA